MNRVYPIKQLCKDFAYGRCYLGPRCRHRHKLLLMEHICDYVQICNSNNSCHRPFCKFLHVSTQEEKLFRSRGPLPSELVFKYKCVLSILIKKFGWRYVEQETCLLQMIAAGSPPESANHPQQVSIQNFLQPPVPAPSPWSPITRTGHQQPPQPIGAIKQTFPFHLPPPTLESLNIRCSVMDTNATQSTPCTPRSPSLGTNWDTINRKRWEESMTPLMPVQVSPAMNVVQTSTQVLPPLQSLPLRNANTDKTLEPDHSNNSTDSPTIPKLEEVKTNWRPPTISSRRSSEIGVARELPRSQPPSSSLQSSTTNTQIPKTITSFTSYPNIIATKIETNRIPSIINSRRFSDINLTGEPYRTQPPSWTPQSSTTNTKIPKTITFYASQPNIVATEVKTNQIPSIISSRRPSEISVARDPPRTQPPSSSPPAQSPQWTLYAGISKTMPCYISDPNFVATEAKTNRKPSTIISRSSSEISAAREPPRTQLSSSSVQSSTLNTEISKTVKSYTSDHNNIATEVKTNQKPSTINSRKSSEISAAREPPRTQLSSSSLQSSTLNTEISTAMSSFTSDHNNIATEVKTNRKPSTINSRRSSEIRAGREPAKTQPPSLSPQSSTLNTEISKTMTSYTSDHNNIATEVKTNRKPSTINSRRSSEISAALETPKTQPSSLSPQSSTLNAEISKTMTSYTSDHNNIATEVKTNRKPSTINSGRSSEISAAREPPRTQPPSLSPQSSTLNTEISKTMPCYISHPNFVATEVKTNRKPSTISSRRSSDINVARELSRTQPPSSLPQSLTTNTKISKTIPCYTSNANFVAVETDSARSPIMRVKRPSPLDPPKIATPPPPPQSSSLTLSASPQSLNTDTIISSTMTSLTSDSNFGAIEVKTEPKSPIPDSSRSPILSVERAPPPPQPPLPPYSPPPLSPASKTMTLDPNFGAIEVKDEPKSPIPDSSRSPMSAERALLLASATTAPPPPMQPPLPPYSPPPLSPELLTTNAVVSKSIPSDSNFGATEIKAEPKSPIPESLTTAPPPPPPPSPPPPLLPQTLTTNAMISETMTSEPSFGAIEVKTEPNSPTAIKRKSVSTLMDELLSYIAEKRRKMESPEAKANKVDNLQNSANTSLNVETCAEIITPFPMASSMGAESFASMHVSPTLPSVQSVSWPPVPKHTHLSDIPWETIQQILNQKPPPPPPENKPAILMDCRNSDKCGERCTIEKFLLYETVVHQTSLLRSLAQSFLKEPDLAVEKFGEEASASVLAYI